MYNHPYKCISVLSLYLFKKSTKPEKNKAKNYFNIKKTLSRHDTNIENNKYKENKIINNNNNIARKTSNSKPKTMTSPGIEIPNSEKILTQPAAI